MLEEIITKVGVVAAIALPLWNIPLIKRIIKRKSSRDLSLWWVLGVWGCLLLMLPSGLITDDIVWKTFNIANFFLFSFVAVVAVKYRKGLINEQQQS